MLDEALITINRILNAMIISVLCYSVAFFGFSSMLLVSVATSLFRGIFVFVAPILKYNKNDIHPEL